MPLRRLFLVIAGLALLAPQAWGHGNECLFARLAVGNDGEVVLELTADWNGNPLFIDESHARTVLSEALRVRQDGSLHRLDELGSLRFESRSQYSADTPMPPSPPTGDVAVHQLLTAVWRTHLPGASISFVTPQRTPHDVVLWRVPPAGESPLRMLLICGEQSPAFTVPMGKMAPSPQAYWLGGALLAALFPLIGWQIARSVRRDRSAVVRAVGP